MQFSSATVDVGEDAAVPLCAVSEDGVRIRNTGDVTAYFGGPDVAGDDDSGGYPVEPGTSDTFTAPKRKDSPIVPAPENDTALPTLYARTARGSGSTRISWLTVS